MKSLIRKIARYAITILLVIIAVVIIYRAWVFYTESPWTRDAKFAADVVAISPDVTGLITDVPVHDNQLVKKGDRPGEQRSANHGTSAGEIDRHA